MDVTIPETPQSTGSSRSSITHGSEVIEPDSATSEFGSNDSAYAVSLHSGDMSPGGKITPNNRVPGFLLALRTKQNKLQQSEKLLEKREMSMTDHCPRASRLDNGCGNDASKSTSGVKENASLDTLGKDDSKERPLKNDLINTLSHGCHPAVTGRALLERSTDLHDQDAEDTMKQVRFASPLRGGSCSEGVPEISTKRTTLRQESEQLALNLLLGAKESTSRKTVGAVIPFVQPHRSGSIEATSPVKNVRREISFFKAFPEYSNRSIDTMSESDIASKIVEIKRRPSRKATWGERLAFARLYRKDVHDERDGAWQSTLSNAETTNEDAAGIKTLSTLFNLPPNPIPMLYEGQLAFRDGTLVNGKLPRSRAVYKVGKR